MKDLRVIFDMDGVILDSERVYQDIEWRMYREIGAPVSKEEHLSYMGTAESWMWDTVVRKHLERLDSRKFNTKQPEEIVRQLIGEERKRFVEKLEEPGEIPLMDGLLPLLSELKKEGIPCLIASSSARYIIETMLECKGLAEYFPAYVGGDEVGRAKPSPELYLKAAELAGAPPAECIAIEDSPNGIHSALDAGMPVIGLVHGDHSGEAELDFSGAALTINSLSELDINRLRNILPQF